MYNVRGRFASIILAAMMVAAFVFVAHSPFVGSTAAASCPSSSTLKIGMFGGAPNSFNMLTALPLSGTGSANIMFNYLYPNPTSAGVLDYNDSVIDWYSTNANYTKWTFNIKPGLKWSNGQPVTSQDILNTYSQSFALNASVDFVNAGAEISSIQKLNSSAVVFNLNKSDAHFGERVGSNIFTTVMPQSFISQGSTFDGFGVVDVGTGPYVADDYAPGTPQAIFLRNPYYHPYPQACALQINYYESDSQIPSYIQSDSISLGPVPTASVASLLQNPNIHIIDQKGMMRDMLLYNVSKYPYNMTAFRQALAYGINQTAIADIAYNGYAEPGWASQGGVPETTTAWYSPHQTIYSYNMSEALRLLSTIGITKNSSGHLTYPNGTEITLTIWYDDTFGGNSVAMGIAQSDLQALGFNVVLNAVDLGTLISDSYANAHDINSAMIYFKSLGSIPGYAWTSAIPSYQIDAPVAAPPTWEGPPGSVAQAEYASNLSAVDATNNPTELYHFLANIQALNAANLPMIVLSYSDVVWAYNSQGWTHWPSTLMLLPNVVNQSALAQITPVSATSPTSSPTTPSTSPTTSSASSSTSAPAQVVTSTTAPSSTNYTLIVAVAVIVVIVIIAGVMLLMRRR